MNLKERIAALSALGEFLIHQQDDPILMACIQQAYNENKWFTIENTQAALTAIGQRLLDKELLTDWANHYPISTHPEQSRTVGLIMAGNIPLVGFHDWVSVFVAGHRAEVKLSDKDRLLLPFLVKKLGEFQFEALAYTKFLVEGEPLSGFDAVIATGSNNTARYFETYFAKYPHIIRKNRNGIAVLTGSETKEDIMALGLDIFTYFGLGCRNVSKIYVPHGYNFDFLLETLHEYREIINHDKYKNNFDYNFTLFIINNLPHKNNGCILLKEDELIGSRIASVHYEYYNDMYELEPDLLAKSEQIQCIVSRSKIGDLKTISFGESQKPGLFDYPDGVDIMAFLVNLK